MLHPAFPTNRFPRSGFSLIEVLLVVTIMAVFVAFALTSHEPADHERLEGAARVLMADLEYVRQLAVQNNTTYRVRFDLDEGSYTLSHLGANPSLNMLPANRLHGQAAAKEQTIELASLPFGQFLGLAAVHRVQGDSFHNTVDLEFGPLGETTVSSSTVVWLRGGAGGRSQFLPVWVNPITGITNLGNTESAAPTQAYYAALAGGSAGGTGTQSGQGGTGDEDQGSAGGSGTAADDQGASPSNGNGDSGESGSAGDEGDLGAGSFDF